MKRTKCMLQRKETDQLDTQRLTRAVVVVSGFRCECVLPNKKENHKRLGNQGFARASFIKPVPLQYRKIRSNDFNTVLPS